MFIVLAIFLGLGYNYFFGGLSFNSTLCLIAGIFLIMPALLKFSFKDLFILKEHKTITALNLVLNFLIVPGLFYFIGGLFFEVEYMKYAFLLLGLISGGGLLLSWAHKTGSDLKLTFSLFILNFIIFSVLFFPLNDFLLAKGEIYKSSLDTTSSFINLPNQNTDITCILDSIVAGCGFTPGQGPSPIAAFLSLILIPFIVSRFIRLSKSFTNYLSSKIGIISQVATFLIIFYIFSLKEVNNIFNFDYFFILKIIGVVLLLYLIIYAITYIIYHIYGKTTEVKALFWVTTTRFITLGLIFSFVYSSVFGVEFLLVFSLAYFVQVFLSVMFTKILKK
ncbi:MAG: hypothetical protein PHH06_00470 [Candidatus Gracilibacteria bacterium]|nr:hypothetical protein [Candidatus Gracilibacteria bacterium]